MHVAISAEDVVVIVSLDMTLATSKIVAKPTKDKFNEKGFEFEAHAWVFLSGHMRAM